MANVVVLIGTLDFGADDYFRETLQFAQGATRSHSHAPPALVLVYNKACGGTDSVQRETERFLQAHDREGRLRRYFSQIRCLRLPMFRSEDEHGALFAPGVAQLQQVVHELATLHHAQQQVCLGHALLEDEWLQLYRYVAAGVCGGGRLSLMDALVHLQTSDDRLVSWAVELYRVLNDFFPPAVNSVLRALLDSYDIRSSDARQSSADVIAEADVLSLALEALTYDTCLNVAYRAFLLLLQRADPTTMTLDTVLPRLARLTDAMRATLPCTAMHPDYRHSHVTCELRRGNHGAYHSAKLRNLDPRDRAPDAKGWVAKAQNNKEISKERTKEGKKEDKRGNKRKEKRKKKERKKERR